MSINTHSYNLQVMECCVINKWRGFWIIVVNFWTRTTKWGSYYMKISSLLCVVGLHLFLIIMFLGYHLLLGVGGFAKLCAIGRNPRINTHSWVDLLETHGNFRMGNPRWKVTNSPTCLYCCNEPQGFLIGVVNGGA